MCDASTNYESIFTAPSKRKKTSLYLCLAMNLKAMRFNMEIKFYEIFEHVFTSISYNNCI